MGGKIIRYKPRPGAGHLQVKISFRVSELFESWVVSPPKSQKSETSHCTCISLIQHSENVEEEEGERKRKLGAEGTLLLKAVSGHRSCPHELCSLQSVPSLCLPGTEHPPGLFSLVANFSYLSASSALT